jgi:hypothetical protein
MSNSSESPAPNGWAQLAKRRVNWLTEADVFIGLLGGK